MGKMKDLFISMQEGLMQGADVDREIRQRMLDDEYRYTIYKKEKKIKTKEDE
jgi:hypothetical protein